MDYLFTLRKDIGGCIFKAILKLTDQFEVMALRWFSLKRRRLFFWILIIILLFLVPHLPYVNLVFSTSTALVLIFLLTPLILDLDAKFFFMVAMFLLILALFLVLLGKNGDSEMFGEYIFIVALAGFIQAIVSS